MAIYFYSKTEEYGFLSNFAPHGFVEDGKRWKTVEHYFQAKKFEDAGHAEKIRVSATPKEARELGQSRKFPIRKDWEDARLEVMRHALRQKFASRELADRLIATGQEELCENSPVDHYWGIGKTGQGENRLGLLLMELREEIRPDPPHPQ